MSDIITNTTNTNDCKVFKVYLSKYTATNISSSNLVINNSTVNGINVTNALDNLQNSKLDKGTYVGNAQDLKNAIDSKANTSHTHDISNVTNLQTTLNNKLDKGTYSGTAQDLYTHIEGKIDAGYNCIPVVGNGASGKVLVDSAVSQINGKISIGLAGEASEKLDVNGNVKAIDFKGQSIKFNLQTSITPTSNTLIPKVDGSRPTWYNNSSIAKDIALLEDINSTNVTNAINNVNSSQLTTIRTKIFGSTTPASPVLNGISRSFIAQGEQNVLIDLFGLNLTLLDPTSVYIINPNDNSFLYAKSFANKTTTVVTTVWDIPSDFPIGNYPIKIQITNVPQGISTANVNIVSAYTLVDINQSSWKRKVRMKPDNSGEYTFLDTNTQYGLNYLQYQDTVSLVAGDVMKDSSGFDTSGGFAMITNSELLANKDWEVTINIKYLNYSGNSTPYGYLVGVTSTNHSNFNLLTDLVKTASFLGRPTSFGGFETGVAEKAIPAGGTVTVVMSKTGNSIFMRYIYFDGTNYTYQYKKVTGIDSAIPYSIFIKEPVGIWASNTYFQIKQAFFNVKIMN